MHYGHGGRWKEGDRKKGPKIAVVEKLFLRVKRDGEQRRVRVARTTKP